MARRRARTSLAARARVFWYAAAGHGAGWSVAHELNDQKPSVVAELVGRFLDDRLLLGRGASASPASPSSGDPAVAAASPPTPARRRDERALGVRGGGFDGPAPAEASASEWTESETAPHAVRPLVALGGVRLDLTRFSLPLTARAAVVTADDADDDDGLTRHGIVVTLHARAIRSDDASRSDDWARPSDRPPRSDSNSLVCGHGEASPLRGLHKETVDEAQAQLEAIRDALEASASHRSRPLLPVHAAALDGTLGRCALSSWRWQERKAARTAGARQSPQAASHQPKAACAL